jgi:hypothetical protein
MTGRQTKTHRVQKQMERKSEKASVGDSFSISEGKKKDEAEIKKHKSQSLWKICLLALNSGNGKNIPMTVG